MTQRRKSLESRLWCIILPLAGLAGLAYETIYDQSDHPSRDWVFFSLVVFPFMAKQDEQGGMLSRVARRILESMAGRDEEPGP